MNRFLGFLCLIILSLSLYACQQPAAQLGGDSAIPDQNMKAIIQTSLHYGTLPSASGLEMLGDHYYVVGDDSPYLYRLDKNFRIESQEAIFDTAGFENGRVAKAEKADLEGMTLLQHQGKPYLLMMGSGASPNRRKGYLYNICGDDICKEGASTHGAKAVDLDPLYRALEASADTLGSKIINIEGVAAGHGKLYLLQRAIGAGLNVLISYKLADFIPYLLGESGAAIPEHELTYFNIPELQDQQAGFSGAYVYDDKLFFTASVEHTSDAIADGEVLGSFVGYIPFNRLTAASDIIQLPATLITHPDGKPYTGKAESLVVQKREGKGRYRLVVVSDDDKGGSELLEVVLRVE